MLTASELRAGMAVRVEGTLCKVLGVDHHSGQGKMGGTTHAKLRNLDTGTMREWRFRGDVEKGTYVERAKTGKR
jgi:elongation factor P